MEIPLGPAIKILLFDYVISIGASKEKLMNPRWTFSATDTVVVVVLLLMSLLISTSTSTSLTV